MGSSAFYIVRYLRCSFFWLSDRSDSKSGKARESPERREVSLFTRQQEKHPHSLLGYLLEVIEKFWIPCSLLCVLASLRVHLPTWLLINLIIETVEVKGLRLRVLGNTVKEPDSGSLECVFSKTWDKWGLKQPSSAAVLQSSKNSFLVKVSFYRMPGNSWDCD